MKARLEAVREEPRAAGPDPDPGKIRNIKVTVAYDGTAYRGFQAQVGGGTIQDALEAAVLAVTGSAARVIGAGRTDAGVHALGQVANFRTAARIPVDRIPYALNSVLPPDIVVTGAEEAGERFSARRGARGKVYVYLVYTGPFANPLWRNHAVHRVGPLDGEAMRRAAEALVGEHDFSSFRAAGGAPISPVRNLRRLVIVRGWPPGTGTAPSLAAWSSDPPGGTPGVRAPGASAPRGNLWAFTFEADGFLYRMVRNMMGALLAVGEGRMAPGEMERVLAARDRRAAPETAPPHGLHLVKVMY